MNVARILAEKGSSVVTVSPDKTLEEVIQILADRRIGALVVAHDDGSVAGIISERVSGMLRHYDFVSERTLAYFTPRLTQAPRDVEFALGYVKERARTRERQEAVLAALRFKCDLLWAQLDALHHAYVSPGLPPPGAFVP